VHFLKVDTLVVLAGAAAAPSNWTTWWQMDTDCTATSGAGFDNRPFGQLQSTGDQQSLSSTMIAGVTAGAHNFLLCAFSNSAASAFSEVIDLQTIPRGSTGGATLGQGTTQQRPAGRLGNIATP
jgi:hypothetical protein